MTDKQLLLNQKISGKTRPRLNLKQYLGTCLDEMRNTIKFSVRVTGHWVETWIAGFPNVI